MSVALSVKPENPAPLDIRFIPYHIFTGQENMCVDHYLASIYAPEAPAVFRFYGWSPFCISLGFHQPAEHVNIDHLKKYKYDIVRRPTGGRAILHARELTYSVIVPAGFLAPRELYTFIHTLWAQALQSLGYAVTLVQEDNPAPSPRAGSEGIPCFTHSVYGEIQCQGKKVVGSAQRIYPRSILQHGSILIGDEHEQLSEFISNTAQEENLIRTEIKTRTCSLNKIGNNEISEEEIIKSFMERIGLFSNIFINFNDLTKDELEAARTYRIAL